MRLLLTGDWQADSYNLDLCAIAAQELLDLANKLQPDAIIHLGDAKEAYSPVPVPVVKFWVYTFAQWKKAGHRVILLKGNHDRISQSGDSEDWLSVFRTVESVAKPKVIPVGDGYLFCLPYTGDRHEEKLWARKLWKKYSVRTMPGVCLFHTDIFGAQMNSAGVKSTGAQDKDLHVSEYDAAFGGHLHCYQRMFTQTWYVGSPFAHGWDEANVKHGFSYVEVDKNKIKEIKQYSCSIPPWYDAEWLESTKTKPEHGSYIRSRVQVSSKKITAQITHEEERLAQSYPGCRLFVAPKVVQEDNQTLVLSGASDREKLEKYVAATIPETAKFTAKRAVGYLSAKLPQKTALGARSASLRVIKTVATNVLSFKNVEVSYLKQGLVLVRGVNKDLPGRSNGSGKTNLLSLLPIGLCGETLKEQKNDAWAYERNTETAVIKQYFRDGTGRKLEVIRQRRPHRIELHINGKNVSEGLTGKRKIETQGIIEEATGFDLRMLKNSIYIDQTIANGFVFGTQKDRMDLINKLCALERFDAAQKIVAEDIKNVTKERTQIESQIDNWEDDLTDISDQLETTGKLASKSWAAELDESKKETGRCRIIYQGLVNNKNFYDTAQERVDDWNADLKIAFGNVNQWSDELSKYKALHVRAVKLINEEKCPTCGQPAQEVGRSLAKSFKDKMDNASAELSKWSKERDALILKIGKDQKTLNNYHGDLSTSKSTLDNAVERQARAQTGVESETKNTQLIQEKLNRLKTRESTINRLLQAARHSLSEIDKSISLYDYARKAFQRSGIPLYMAGSLCPMLNQAAEEFSDYFTNGAIRIQFAIEDCEFVVNILNATGSSKSEGQSVGESAMAGVITAFSLREAAPKTNLLILDEPGHGLDETGQRQFARGLLKIKDRYSTILLTTHSQIIESELLGEAKIWTIEKQKGVSKLVIL